MQKASHFFIFLNKIKFGVMPTLTREVKSADIGNDGEAGEEVIPGMANVALISWRRMPVCVLKSSSCEVCLKV